MARIEQSITIRQHAQRLYNAAMPACVTVEDLDVMVEDDSGFVVYDAKTGDDITRSVLKRIILQRASHG